jgi:hypothetical protein
MLDVLERMRVRHGVVVDPEDETTVLWPSGSGHQMVVAFLEYLPEKVTQLMSGAVLHVGSASGSGSKARAETESDEAEGMIQFDREVIDEALTDCLVAQVWRLNRGNIVAPGSARPRCRGSPRSGRSGRTRRRTSGWRRRCSTPASR